ncbi:MAG TPA: hypothetical protein VFI02_14135 [Armatimonadota bacterium]|nr:hypothetical protein [Armatimonadota bacterium]
MNRDSKLTVNVTAGVNNWIKEKCDKEGVPKSQLIYNILRRAMAEDLSRSKTFPALHQTI